MFPVDQPFFPATKASFDAQLAILTALAQATLENTEKIIDFNMKAVKANWEKSTTSTKQMLSAEDPKASLSMAAAHAQDNIEAAISYSRNMAEMVSASRNELTKKLDAQSAEFRRQISAAVDQMASKAPAGAEASIALVKSAVNTINAGYEQWTSVTRQAVAAMENQFSAVADQVSQAAAKRPNNQTGKK